MVYQLFPPSTFHYFSLIKYKISALSLSDLFLVIFIANNAI